METRIKAFEEDIAKYAENQKISQKKIAKLEIENESLLGNIRENEDVIQSLTSKYDLIQEQFAMFQVESEEIKEKTCIENSEIFSKFYEREKELNFAIEKLETYEKGLKIKNYQINTFNVIRYKNNSEVSFGGLKEKLEEKCDLTKKEKLLFSETHGPIKFGMNSSLSKFEGFTHFKTKMRVSHENYHSESVRSLLNKYSGQTSSKVIDYGFQSQQKSNKFTDILKKSMSPEKVFTSKLNTNRSNRVFESEKKRILDSLKNFNC